MSNLPTVLIDTREQNPWSFPDLPVICKKLDVGDYTIAGFEDKVVIERKSLADAFATMSRGKTNQANLDRWHRELDRMADIPHRFVVLEGSIKAVWRGIPYSQYHPSCLLGDLVALMVDRGTHVVFADNRAVASNLAQRILLRVWKNEGGL